MTWGLRTPGEVQWWMFMSKYFCVIVTSISLYNLVTTGTHTMNIWITSIIPCIKMEGRGSTSQKAGLLVVCFFLTLSFPLFSLLFYCYCCFVLFFEKDIRQLQPLVEASNLRFRTIPGSWREVLSSSPDRRPELQLERMAICLGVHGARMENSEE